MEAATKTVLDPETIPSVAIDFMNNTHFEEIAMVQDLGDLITAYQEGETQDDATSEKIVTLLDSWLEHTHAHFTRENELMEKYGFPAFEIHAHEHTIALEKMETVVSDWKANKNIELLADYVFTLWPAWFSGHVNSMDMITAQFAVNSGFSPE